MYVWSKALSGNNCFPQVGSADWQVAGRVELRLEMGTQADRAPTFRQRTARDELGARLHGATACSLNLRRMDPEPIARCKPLQVKKDEMLGVSRFRKQLLCNQGTTFRRGESLKWAADKRHWTLAGQRHRHVANSCSVQPSVCTFPKDHSERRFVQLAYYTNSKPKNNYTLTNEAKACVCYVLFSM